MTEKIFRVECDCGSDIHAETREEAIKKFMKQHNFPCPNTKDYWDSFKGYAEEFEVYEK